MPALATSSRLLDTLTDLYDSTSCCPDLEAHAAAQNVDPKERKLFEALAKARHAAPDQSRQDTLKSPEWKNLYKYVSEQLTGGAEKGYGKQLVKLDFDTPDYRMLSKLTESLHWFSANKNWQLLVDLNGLLKKDDKLREWADFKKEALRLDKQYNTIWLRTEYNAAVASSQMAAKWVGFEESQDDTYLRYDTAGDRRVRPAHALLDGITLPATDAFWSSFYPPIDWACRCDVTEVLRSRAKPTDLQQKGPLPQIAEGFKSNVGKSGQVFDQTHPYFKSVPKEEQLQLRFISDDQAYQDGAGKQYEEDVKTVFNDPKQSQMGFAETRFQGFRGKLLPELTVQEKSLLYDYTADGYRVNQALMDKRPATKFEEGYTRLLDRSLGKLPNYEGQVYRRTDLLPTELAQYKPGAKITGKAFTSTSTDPNETGGGKYEFVIQSRTGKSIKAVSEFEEEAEILFRTGTRFEVLKVEGSTIFMSEIP